MTSAAAAVRRIVAGMSSVDLQTLNDRAEMLTRTDRKYVVSVAQLEVLMEEVGGGLQVLDIDGRQLFAYSSTYFDTDDLTTYRAHLQRRRRRYKIRLRAYLDTGGQFVEVKYKGHRQLTYKTRIEHEQTYAASLPDGHLGLLGRQGESFAEQVIGQVYGVGLPGPLAPVVTTRNDRATFLSPADDSRLTIDVDVRFHGYGGSASMRDGFALIETKSSTGATPADRALRRMKVRPTSISKYCAAVALLQHEVPSNPWHRLVRSYFDVSGAPS